MVNSVLSDTPGLLNREPEGEGWIVKVKVEEAAFVEGLMDEAQYEEFKKGEAEKDE